MITEPMTMVTDCVLGAACLGFAAALRGEARRRGQRSVRTAAGAFAATGLAALIGGTSHGFALMMDPATRRILWKLTVFALGTASFFLLSAMLEAGLSPGLRRVLGVLNLLKLVLYLGWMTAHDDFRFAVYDYVASLLVVALVALVRLARKSGTGQGWLVAGIALSLGAGALQQVGFGPHAHFNHNDLYHVIQTGAMWLLYRGARMLSDWRASDPR